MILAILAVISVASCPDVPLASVSAAGDIVMCGELLPRAESTAALLDRFPSSTVFALGDISNDVGSSDNYAQCVGPTWGRHKSRMKTIPGNHDWMTSSGAPYFSYFGSSAGTPGVGYYSFDIGGWHVAAVNVNLPMTAGSEQDLWLRADLAAHPLGCQMILVHYPLFSSGAWADSSVLPVWQAGNDYGVDVILNGHDHVYERFALQTPAGVAAPVTGIRQFTVGTGGATEFWATQSAANSEKLVIYRTGILNLSLWADRYAWEFVGTGLNGTTQVLDSGTASCH